MTDANDKIGQFGGRSRLGDVDGGIIGTVDTRVILCEKFETHIAWLAGCVKDVQ